jgi:SAM-dependent methyltransferase
MHPQAYDFVAAHAHPAPGLKVLDIGGQDMNGTVRPLFPGAEYVCLDLVDGPGVDIVADATQWHPGWPPDEGFDVVVCCEVFEHTPDWRKIIRTAFEALRPGGRFIATMAGPGRPQHSGRRAALAIDPDEYYENVVPVCLLDAVEGAGFVDVVMDVVGGSTDPRRKTEDVRVTARRP